jgi:hypothetical protein
MPAGGGGFRIASLQLPADADHPPDHQRNNEHEDQPHHASDQQVRAVVWRRHASEDAVVEGVHPENRTWSRCSASSETFHQALSTPPHLDMSH